MAGNQVRRLSSVAGIWMVLMTVLLVTLALVVEAASDDQKVNVGSCVSACWNKCSGSKSFTWCFIKCLTKCRAGVASEAAGKCAFNCAKQKCSKFAPDRECESVNFANSKEFEDCIKSCGHECDAKLS